MHGVFWLCGISWLILVLLPKKILEHSYVSKWSCELWNLQSVFSIQMKINIYWKLLNIDVLWWSQRVSMLFTIFFILIFFLLLSNFLWLLFYTYKVILNTWACIKNIFFKCLGSKTMWWGKKTWPKIRFPSTFYQNRNCSMTLFCKSCTDVSTCPTVLK